MNNCPIIVTETYVNGRRVIDILERETIVSNDQLTHTYKYRLVIDPQTFEIRKAR